MGIGILPLVSNKYPLMRVHLIILFIFFLGQDFTLIQSYRQSNCRYSVYWELEYLNGPFKGDRRIGYSGSYESLAECDGNTSKYLGKETDGPGGIKELVFMVQCKGCGETGPAYYYVGYAPNSTVREAPASPTYLNRGTSTIAHPNTPPGDAEAPAPSTTSKANPEAPHPDESYATPLEPGIQSEHKKYDTGKDAGNNDEEVLQEIMIQSVPGIQSAVDRYLDEKERNKRDPAPHDYKPEGYRSSDIPVSEWVMSEGTEASADGEPGEEAGGWMEDVKGFFSKASTTSEILGQEEHANTFGFASKVMGYAEAASHLADAYADPSDDNARMEVVKDGFKYMGKATGTAGMAFNKFGPPADLQQRTFEGAFQRMNSLIETGDPGDEIAVTAPLLNWFGAATGMGDIGTRERRYRQEGYKSFSELKNKYGWNEAVKQKVYNWVRED